MTFRCSLEIGVSQVWEEMFSSLWFRLLLYIMKGNLLFTANKVRFGRGREIMFDLCPYETGKELRHPSRGYMMVKYH